VSLGPYVPTGTAAYAREKIGRAIRHVSEPILGVRVRVTQHNNPAAANPCVAQANVDFDGRPVRVQVTAATGAEAVDLLEDRLRTRLQRMARHWEAVRRGQAGGPREWHHGDRPHSLLPYFPRAVEQRQVLRRKSFGLAEETCDEAAFEMEMMDYDFHLFTESGSGADSVLYRADGEFRLAQVSPRPESVTRGALEFTVSPSPAPVLDTDDAIERLELTGWPFVFFVDKQLRRGCVLYHRFDGHYGLITPAE
jgi:ribosome-associated translation inhibitor RaiA